ncbi:MAG: hypothetical protein D6725_12200 [Planctomycetota bacterium]|nr:MAG: hypothetical protein D6725_12200 [Planctomycetota bacterium]
MARSSPTFHRHRLSTHAQAGYRIVFLGGNLGTLAAAFHLLREQPNRRRFDVRLFFTDRCPLSACMHGAPGPPLEPAANSGSVLLGGYWNTLSLARTVYQTARAEGLLRDSPFSELANVLEPQSVVSLIETRPAGHYRWNLTFPQRKDGPSAGTPRAADPWKVLCDGLRWLVARVSRSVYPAVQFAVERSAVDLQREILSSGLHNLAVEMIGTSDDGPYSHLHLAADWADRMSSNVSHHLSREYAAIDRLGTRFMTILRQAIDAGTSEIGELREWTLCDLAWTCLVGLIRDAVIWHGFEPLNRYDFREWLTRHGADPGTVGSAPVEAVYDFLHAYEFGFDDRPNLAAGAALRFVCRSVAGYSQAFWYGLKVPPAESLLMPLWKLLRHWGVRFERCMCVERIESAGDGTQVQQVSLSLGSAVPTGDGLPDRDGSATTGQGPPAVNPLRADSFRYGPTGRLTLRAQEDFDCVVCGLPIEQTRNVTQSLAAVNETWRDGMAAVSDAAVLVAQGRLPTPPEQRICVLPRKLLVAGLRSMVVHAAPSSDHAEESTPHRDEEPMPLQFTAPVPAGTARTRHDASGGQPKEEGDESAYAAAIERTRRRFDTLAAVLLHGFLPHGEHSTSPVSRPEAQGVVHWQDASAPPRLAHQGQMPRTSGAARIVPDATGFRNLMAVGDWTANGLNVACVESAVMSGMMVARALCGAPDTIPGEFDVHRGVPYRITLQRRKAALARLHSRIRQAIRMMFRRAEHD